MSRYAELVQRGVYGLDKEALFELGVMFRDGTGVEKNDKEAETWFGMARRMGHPAARQEILGLHGTREQVQVPVEELELPEVERREPPVLEEIPEPPVLDEFKEPPVLEEILEPPVLDETLVALTEVEFIEIRNFSNAEEARTYIQNRNLDIHTQDQDGSLLHGIYNHKVANLLLEMGLSPNVRDDMGGTPLHACLDAGVCKVLIDAGALVDALDELGKTPLMRSASLGNFEVAKRLVENGADLTLQDEIYCNTALDEAENNIWKDDPAYADSAKGCELIALLIRERLEVKGVAWCPSGHCPSGHGPMREWDGQLRCWVCGYSEAGGRLNKPVFVRPQVRGRAGHGTGKVKESYTGVWIVIVILFVLFLMGSCMDALSELV